MTPPLQIIAATLALNGAPANVSDMSLTEIVLPTPKIVQVSSELPSLPGIVIDPNGYTLTGVTSDGAASGGDDPEDEPNVFTFDGPITGGESLEQRAEPESPIIPPDFPAIHVGACYRRVLLGLSPGTKRDFREANGQLGFLYSGTDEIVKPGVQFGCFSVDADFDTGLQPYGTGLLNLQIEFDPGIFPGTDDSRASQAGFILSDLGPANIRWENKITAYFTMGIGGKYAPWELKLGPMQGYLAGHVGTVMYVSDSTFTGIIENPIDNAELSRVYQTPIVLPQTLVSKTRSAGPGWYVQAGLGAFLQVFEALGRNFGVDLFGGARAEELYLEVEPEGGPVRRVNAGANGFIATVKVGYAPDQRRVE